MKAQTLLSERLLLRPLSLEHLSQDYVAWLNDSEVNMYLDSGEGYTIQMLQDYLLNVVKNDIYFWAVHIKETNIHIGNIKIDPINQKHGYGEYGIMMGRKTEWGKGYAKEATELVIDYCFSTLQLRKINLGVVVDNTAAVALYDKLGFQIEGVYKKHGLYNGKYCDSLRMAIFNPNWNDEA